MRIELDEGKYVVEMDNGKMTFYRHGEPWPAAQDSFEHSKLISSMVYRIAELEGKP